MLPAFNKKHFVKDLTEGRNYSIPLLVVSVKEGVTRANSPYLTLRLMDRTGSVTAKVWNDAERLRSKLAEGRVAVFQGRVELWQERPQLNVKNVFLADESEVNQEDYVPVSARAPEDMRGEFMGLVASIADPDFRGITERALGRDEAQGFWTAPAAKHFHHAFRGGLLEHTLSVLKLADMFSRHYAALLNRSLLMAGAALHDVGKVWEFTAPPGQDYTTKGRLLGHLVTGPIFLAEVAAGMPGFPEEKLLLLQHLLASHHGAPEMGAAAVPMLLEAWALHFADNMDSKLNGINDIIRAEVVSPDPAHPASMWTTYNRQLESYFMLTPRYGEDGEVRPVAPSAPVGLSLESHRGGDGRAHETALGGDGRAHETALGGYDRELEAPPNVDDREFEDHEIVDGLNLDTPWGGDGPASEAVGGADGRGPDRDGPSSPPPGRVDVTFSIGDPADVSAGPSLGGSGPTDGHSGPADGHEGPKDSLEGPQDGHAGPADALSPSLGFGLSSTFMVPKGGGRNGQPDQEGVAAPDARAVAAEVGSGAETPSEFASGAETPSEFASGTRAGASPADVLSDGEGMEPWDTDRPGPIRYSSLPAVDDEEAPGDVPDQDASVEPVTEYGLGRDAGTVTSSGADDQKPRISEDSLPREGNPGPFSSEEIVPATEGSGDTGSGTALVKAAFSDGGGDTAGLFGGTGGDAAGLFGGTGGDAAGLFGGTDGGAEAEREGSREADRDLNEDGDNHDGAVDGLTLAGLVDGGTPSKAIRLAAGGTALTEASDSPDDSVPPDAPDAAASFVKTADSKAPSAVTSAVTEAPSLPEGESLASAVTASEPMPVPEADAGGDAAGEGDAYADADDATPVSGATGRAEAEHFAEAPSVPESVIGADAGPAGSAPSDAGSEPTDAGPVSTDAVPAGSEPAADETAGHVPAVDQVAEAGTATDEVAAGGAAPASAAGESLPKEPPSQKGPTPKGLF
ncbi:MAG: HD domain-containing protein [Deltaproteobacteria bacterium]|nr:HD domain-containing protein [Deltaproteobacteria bacterium]